MDSNEPDDVAPSGSEWTPDSEDDSDYSADSDDALPGLSRNSHSFAETGEETDTQEESGTDRESGSQKKSEKQEEVETRENSIWISPSRARTNKNDRVWDKVHFCLYCGKGYKKLPEHLYEKHESEPEVSEILSLQKGTAKRRSLIAKIRKAGDYDHNRRVLLGEEAGQLVVHRRPNFCTGKTNFNSYMFCSGCQGLYKKAALYRHSKKCKRKAAKRQQHQRAGAALMPTRQSVSNQLKNVIDGMRMDKYTLISRNDSLILKLGEYYVSKAGHTNNSRHYIAQKMREVS